MPPKTDVEQVKLIADTLQALGLLPTAGGSGVAAASAGQAAAAVSQQTLNAID